MKKVKFLALALSVLFMASCGGSEDGDGAASEKKYFINVSAGGEEHSSEGEETSFFGDKISGETKFTVGNSNVVMYECWNNMGPDGITGLEGESFNSDITIGSHEVKGVEATIEKIEKESDEGDIGANYNISGSFKGEATGSFKVSAFKTH